MSQHILHQSSWVQTANGQNIELYESHSLPGSPYLFVGGVHGDEPEGVRLAQDLLAWLSKNSSKIVQPWILIPCLNVDGFQKNERTNGRGVDLNRNFPSPDWSNHAKAPRYNPGSHPASEIEVRALIGLIEQKKPKCIVHFHSWEPSVIYTGSPGKKDAQTLALGTSYKVQEDIGYPTPGSLGQYGWLVHKIPVICIEEQEKVHLSEIWPRFEKGFTQLLTNSKGSVI